MIGTYIQRKLYRLLILGSFVLMACSDNSQPVESDYYDTSLSLNMTKADASIIQNTNVYVFDGEGSGIDQFNHKIQDISYSQDKLYMPLKAGLWGITLVTADRDISRQVIHL